MLIFLKVQRPSIYMSALVYTHVQPSICTLLTVEKFCLFPAVKNVKNKEC